MRTNDRHKTFAQKTIKDTMEIDLDLLKSTKGLLKIAEVVRHLQKFKLVVNCIQCLPFDKKNNALIKFLTLLKNLALFLVLMFLLH